MTDASGLRARGLRSAISGPHDLAVARGTCLGLSGPSGSGKSVLLRMIADLDPHEGEAWLDGAPRAAMAAHEWRRRVGYLPAQPGWWATRAGSHFRHPDATRPLLARLCLRDTILDAPVSQLSTGERQRLALLRALQPGPEVLLLDEPCAALDTDATRVVEDLLQERRAAGLAIVLVSHDAAQLARLATYRLHLDAGRLVPAAP